MTLLQRPRQCERYFSQFRACPGCHTSHLATNTGAKERCWSLVLRELLDGVIGVDRMIPRFHEVFNSQLQRRSPGGIAGRRRTGREKQWKRVRQCVNCFTQMTFIGLMGLDTVRKRSIKPAICPRLPTNTTMQGSTAGPYLPACQRTF